MIPIGNSKRGKYSDRRRRVENREAAIPGNLIPSPGGDPIKEPSPESTAGLPLPSSAFRSRHRRRRGIARLIVVCLILCGLCVGGTLIGSLFKVSAVTVIGEEHESADDLLSTANIPIGSELFALDGEKIAEGLLKRFPYLKSVDVDRSLSGAVTITVTERKPEIALVLPDGGTALLDDTFFTLEICDSAPEGVYLVTIGEVADVTPGEIAGLELRTQGELREAVEAIRHVPLSSRVAFLSMKDRYAVMMTLEDGTILSLHAAKNVEMKLRAAEAVLAGYRRPTDPGYLNVDVSEKAEVRVSFRPEKTPAGDVSDGALG